MMPADILLAKRHSSNIHLSNYRSILVVVVATTIACVLVDLLFGKDMAFDTLNYHMYAGFAALNDRFSLDYFAAGPQSYNNPYAYVPFYLLVNAGLPAITVSLILAGLHSLLLLGTYNLALVVCPIENAKERHFFAGCTAAFVLVNPIVIQQIGSSFADITTAELVLFGWLLLALSIRTQNSLRIISSGALLGAAVALKPTNAVSALGALALLIAIRGTLKARLRSYASFGVALVVAFASISAPWSRQLWRTFGNPFFPLMNSVFKSTEFTTQPIRHYRFIPSSWAEALERPLSIAATFPMVHEELTAPDIRYILLVGCALIFVLSRITKHPLRSEPPHSPDRVFRGLAIGFVSAWSLWLFSSGNGRYFIPMSVVASVVAFTLIYRMLPMNPKGRMCLLATIVLAQALQLAAGGEFRWNPSPWSGEWFNVSVPKTLRDNRNLFLSMGLQSNSFVVPFLSHQSGFINYAGAFTLASSGENGRRVKEYIQSNMPNVRVILSGDGIYPTTKRQVPAVADVDATLSGYALRVDTKDCELINVSGIKPQIELPIETEALAPLPPPSGMRYQSHLVTCRLVMTNATAIAPKVVDEAFTNLELSCPQLFQPRPAQSEASGHAWLRRYANTDMLAWIVDGGLKVAQGTISGSAHALGQIQDWQSGARSVICGRRNDAFFIRLND